MRTWRYQDLDGIHDLTDEEILATYWEWWQAQMLKLATQKVVEISQEACIQDFVVVHWAWEIT